MQIFTEATLKFQFRSKFKFNDYTDTAVWVIAARPTLSDSIMHNSILLSENGCKSQSTFMEVTVWNGNQFL
jgi:hypothetical protein